MKEKEKECSIYTVIVHIFAEAYQKEEDVLHHPTDIFLTLDPHYPFHDVAEQHKICRSPDLEALKLWKGRSGGTAPYVVVVPLSCQWWQLKARPAFFFEMNFAHHNTTSLSYTHTKALINRHWYSLQPTCQTGLPLFWLADNSVSRLALVKDKLFVNPCLSFTITDNILNPSGTSLFECERILKKKLFQTLDLYYSIPWQPVKVYSETQVSKCWGVKLKKTSYLWGIYVTSSMVLPSGCNYKRVVEIRRSVFPRGSRCYRWRLLC